MSQAKQQSTATHRMLSHPATQHINMIIIKFTTKQNEITNKIIFNCQNGWKIKYNRNIKKFWNHIVLSWIAMQTCNKQKEHELAAIMEQYEAYWLVGCDAVCVWQTGTGSLKELWPFICR